MARSSKTDRSQTIPTSIRRLHPPVPIMEHLDEWVSDWYLVLSQTPSARIWTIALWRSGFAKDHQPWRNLVNHPVPGDVIAIYELPPKDYHENVERYNRTNFIRWPTG
jgi:hypothetical protein